MLKQETEGANDLRGKPFACPLCGMVLPLEISKTRKPYCTCRMCMIQIFFRGKVAIARLRNLLRSEKPLPSDIPGPSVAISLYNRLEKLKQQRDELEQKQGMIFRNRDLDNAISAVDAEIKRLQHDLGKTKREAEKKK